MEAEKFFAMSREDNELVKAIELRLRILRGTDEVDIKEEIDFTLSSLEKRIEFEEKYQIAKIDYEQFENELDSLDNLLVESGYNLNDLMFIQGLIFISMVPLHKENSNRQLMLYLTGIQTLNQVTG